VAVDSARQAAIASLVLAACAFAAACAGAGPSAGSDAQPIIQTVISETHSGLAEARRAVIRDAASWARLWSEIHAGRIPAPALPAVDFEREMLIAVASGTRPTGGFSIQVTGVTTRGDRLEIAVLERCPDADAIVTMALTQPVAVVRVAKLTQTPTFQDTRTGACR
jgi:protease stability complex PrcB-like protein